MAEKEFIEVTPITSRKNNGSGNSKKKRTKKQKQRNKLIMFGIEMFLLAVVVVGLVGVSYFKSLYDKIEQGGDLTDSQVGVNPELDSEQIEVLKGYTNIALFGLDNRTAGNYDYGQSDTIMIASINNDTKEIKLVSVYRDTYLSIGEGKFNKANAAYNLGGVVRAVQMLNSNLDLNIKQYVCVNWHALVEAIDALGGVEIDITQQEMHYINAFMAEIDAQTGLSTPHVTQFGKVVLNGTQATSYARIRSTAGSDWRRTSRQRIVLEAMLNKAKSANIQDLLEACNVVFDDIKTNLDLFDIYDLAKDVSSYSLVETSGFPFELTTRELAYTNSTVVPINLEKNVSMLHEFLFETEGYKPSLSVLAISDAIIDKTGVQKDEPPYDMDKYNNTAGQDGTVFD